ncbi:MAG: helix-turn-helix domain-containing protein [bacterium]|nr:helix-turn-helix domain-containing protein [bacterium]
MEIQELGARIKRIRKSRSMTLKDIEGRSRVSATHISEIERGKTSPTIGALSRIASALGKDTAFFLESQNLDDVCRIKYEDREKHVFKTTNGYYQQLTFGIPGGRLQSYRLHLEPGAILQYSPPSTEGEATLMIEQGELRFTSGDEQVDLKIGDSVHFLESEDHGFINPSNSHSVDIILVSTRRHSIDDM